MLSFTYIQVITIVQRRTQGENEITNNPSMSEESLPKAMSQSQTAMSEQLQNASQSNSGNHFLVIRIARLW